MQSTLLLCVFFRFKGGNIRWKTRLLTRSERTPVIAVSETRGNRSIGLDITRIFAFLSVVAVHSFLNTEFYSNIVSGEKMYVMVIFRTAFMVCVPLFLLLTGYLISTKDIALNSSVILGYYKKLLPLILKYIICMLILYTLSMTFGTEDFNFKSIVFGITGFSKYSWYVNMYIGLFLLTPFLNLIWNSISEKKMHIILVLVFIIPTRRGLSNFAYVFLLFVCLTILILRFICIILC